MNTTPKKQSDGWGWPLGATRAHYFQDGRSLCRRWLFFGPLEQQSLMGLKHSIDDCKTCTKTLEKSKP